MELPVAITSYQGLNLDVRAKLIAAERIVFMPAQAGAQAYPVVCIRAPVKQRRTRIAAIVIRVVITVVQVVVETEPLGTQPQIHAPGAVPVNPATGGQVHFLSAVVIAEVRGATQPSTWYSGAGCHRARRRLRVSTISRDTASGDMAYKERSRVNCSIRLSRGYQFPSSR